MKPRIGLDLDGTICDTAGLMIERLIAQGKLPPDTTTKSIKSHYIEWNPEKKTGFQNVSKEDTAKLFTDPNFWADVKIYDGVQEAVNSISKNYEIYIVTARIWNTGVEEATIKWLEKHNIPYDKLISCPAMRKDEIASLYNFMYFIEDYLDAAINIANQVDTVFVIKQPWNDFPRNIPKNIGHVTWEMLNDMFPSGDLSEIAFDHVL